MTQPAPVAKVKATSTTTAVKTKPVAPVRANTPTNKATKQCRILASKPCDVQQLIVRATVLGDEPKERVLKATKRLRGLPVSRAMPRDVARLLDSYDLVIDVTASYPSKEDSSPDKVKIQSWVDYHGTPCALLVHPRIRLQPLNRIEEFAKTPRGLSWAAKQSAPHTFWARSLIWDTQQHDSKLGFIFDLITTMWPGSHQKLLVASAGGCGIRVPGSGAPNREIAALIRIFRNDTWSIVLKLPPLGKYTHERAGTRNLVTGQTERSRTTTTSHTFNRSTSASTSKVTTENGQTTRENSGSSFRGREGQQHWNQRGQHDDGKAYYHSKEQSTAGQGREVYSSKGHQFEWLLPEKIKKPSGFALSIKRNDREIDNAGVKELIENVVKLAEIIKEGFESLKRLPQLGWKITFSISVLEGSIEGQWGPKMVDKVIDGRYLPVQTFFSLKINVMLLSATVELSFGVEAMALGTGVILKLSGSLGCKVPLNVHVKGTHDPFEAKLTPAIECELKVIGYASVAGLSIVDVQVSVTGGITVDGKFVVDPARGLRLEGAVKRKPIVVKGHVKWPLGPPKPMTPLVVLPGADIAKL